MKIILMICLGYGFVTIVSSMAVRAMVPSYGVETSVMGEYFAQFISLFAVVVGYVLGKKSGD